ncbi:cell division ATP-binding protein FtsE [Vagococcus salmoninarum]|uniref:Cell division ATP-binding protein FtsE n=1 Tax=Vagococcus salmoninarum TaxID=2739 RepID=A0A429ZSS9_9ENTE|nr:ATP-binding cassette domain-containing protein [Vagococcus salmoninarum]RST96795.1 cell division ATP-binding protein FtsE [Vagococcus salmoninarum]
MIKLTNVLKQYDNNTWGLKGISCEIHQGEFIYLIGPSGAGKSTLIKLLTCEERLTGGQLQIGNADLGTLKDRRIPFLRRQLGIVSQEVLLINEVTVYRNLVYALQGIGVSHKLIKEKVFNALELVGMLAYKDHLPVELSQGQRQKISIARAIVNQPKIVIADEPTGNLDAKSSVEVMRIFYKLNQLGTTIMMATHNSTIVNTIRYRVIEIRNGEIIRDQKTGGYGLVDDEKDVYII